MFFSMPAQPHRWYQTHRDGYPRCFWAKDAASGDVGTCDNGDDNPCTEIHTRDLASQYWSFEEVP